VDLCKRGSSSWTLIATGQYGNVDFCRNSDIETPRSANTQTGEKTMNRKIFLQTMITLASASLGLVAALAWNEAIKAIIKEVVQTGESIAGLLTYAILATVVAVVVVMLLGRAAARVGGEAAISREAEG
jgi:hypothetical protein